VIMFWCFILCLLVIMFWCFIVCLLVIMFLVFYAVHIGWRLCLGVLYCVGW
jgi:hypothetical protein